MPAPANSNLAEDANRLKAIAMDMFGEDLARDMAERVDMDLRESDRQQGFAFVGLSDRRYSKLGTGVIEGLPNLTWTSPDSFIFTPNSQKPFKYTTSSKFGSKTIIPGLMETDGGSIPRIAQINKKFSPWGYAPAFLIH